MFEQVEFAVGDEQGGEADVCRPSYAQQRIWIAEQLQPKTALYHITMGLRLQGRLDIDALQIAVNAVVARHEALRTTFHYQDGDLQQRCLSQLSLGIDLLRTGKNVNAFLLDQYRCPFDLRQGPLLRVAVLEMADMDHILAISMHHIVSDGVSGTVFARELVAFYNAIIRGEDFSLGELPIQYADFAEWQRSDEVERKTSLSLDYWRQRLNGIEPIDLPYDRPRPAHWLGRGQTLYFDLSKDLVASLQAIGRSQNASLYAVLLTAFYILLKRYSGQSDLTLGTPVSGRGREELENLIGCFVNTVVLRAHVPDDISFNDLLRNVRDTVLEAYTHQDVPFDRVVEQLRPDRSLSHAPLFQVMFAYQESQPDLWQLDGLQVTPIRISFDTSKFDLTLSMSRVAEVLQGAIEFSTELFDEGTILRLRDHFINLLQDIVCRGVGPISSYQIFSPQEHEQLLSCFGQPWVEFPIDYCLHQAFEQQVERTPEAIALTSERGHLSYHDLNVRANRLAHRLLRDRDPGDSEIVGLCVPRDDRMVIAILAVLKAGLAYLPIDSMLGVDRIAFYLLDSCPYAVVTGEEQMLLFDGLLGNGIELISVELGCSIDLPEDDLNPGVSCEPERLAYVLYTSGSTGTPKGVMVSHRNIRRLFLSTQSLFGFTSNDVWSVFHSASFDFSVWELWGALLHGGRAVLVPYLTSRSPEAFCELIRREKVTVMNQTPSAFKQFIAADGASAAEAEPMSLRYIIFGGEALDPASLRPWVERHGDAAPQLINMYGVTETTVHVTYRPITRVDIDYPGLSPIGRSIPDLRIYLLDAMMNPVPIGVTGEIYVSGAGVTNGYLNRMDLTEQHFVTVTPALEAVAGSAQLLYRTGDLAKFTAEGELYYQGRADDQVKIRGFRIELAEIAAALRTHSAIREAVVGTFSDAWGEKQLIAHLVSDDDHISVEQLRTYLLRRLPDYMVPSVMIFVDALPLTSNGKVDRKRLPQLDGYRSNLASTYTEPRDGVERALCEIWGKVLGLERVGIHDNFFALGGDSLRAVRAVAQAREAGLLTSLPQLFELQTVAELASVMTLQDTAPNRPRAVPFSLIDSADRDGMPTSAIDAYPLSRMQAGMFYHMQLSPDSNVYHCTGTSHLRIKGSFDEVAFRMAVQQVVARHDVLRTSFDLTSFSQPLQIVHDKAKLPVVVEDIQHLPSDQQDTYILDLLESEKYTPFDLAKPTLLRFFIHLRGPDHLQFTITECHPIFDGWSYHTMIVEVFNRYAGLTGRGSFIEPPPLQSSYRDFVQAELEAIACDAHRSFWRDQLSDFTALKLPRLVRQTGIVTPPRLKSMRLTLSDKVYEGLQSLMLLASAPMKSVLLAGHLKVMGTVSGQTDVLTGIPTNGRPEESGGDELYGLFLNTLPFRFRLQAQSWEDMVRSVFAHERRCIIYRRYPLAEIQRQLGNVPLLDEVLFNYMDFHVYHNLDKSLGFEVVDALDTGEVNEGTNFPLTVHFQHLTLSSGLAKRRITIQLDYDENQFDADQIVSLIAYYRQVYVQMSANPHQDQSRASLLPEGEQSALADMTRPRRIYAGQDSLGTLFADQVGLHRDEPALIDGEIILTYHMLDARAKKIALLLSAWGVRRGDRVAIYMQRSVDQIASIVAVTMLEAVYVPLDVEAPVVYTAGLLADVDCSLILTQEALAGRLDGVVRKILVTEAADEMDDAASTGMLPVTVSGDHPACVMYTSGSTGQPKGVLIPQSGIIRLVHDTDYVDFCQNGCVLQMSAMNFDASLLEIWGPLLNGGTLVLYPDRLPNLPLMDSLLTQHEVKLLFLTTSLFNMVVDEDIFIMRNLRHVITGGEVMSVAHARKFLSALPHVRLTNAYGPTENTTFTTTYHLHPGDELIEDTVPIGRPINGTYVHVLDEFGQFVPIGSPGELYTGGAGVALGYLGQEALTREKFLPDPVGGDENARVYRTGDRVRLLRNGNLQYLGRLDKQIKLRGFRIEPAEIERVLCTDPVVKTAALHVIRRSQGKRLVAYVVANSDQQPDEGALLLRLRQQLPQYMLPSEVVFLSEFPLTSNGKLDRSRLPPPAERYCDGDRQVLPANEVERKIQAAWSQVLGVSDPDIHRNFFDLGGDSLLLSRLFMRLQGEDLPEMSIVDLLNHPTIRSLSEFLIGSETKSTSRRVSEKEVGARRSSLSMLRQRRGAS